jgi:hypothetical protein
VSFFEIFQPRWRHEDPAIRLAAVADLSDEDKLRNIALSDADQGVRLAAASRATSAETLAWLAESAACPRVRELAVGRVRDEAVLRRVAGSDQDSRVRQTAWLGCGLSGLRRQVMAEELSRLAVAPRVTVTAVAHQGSRDQLVLALLGDRLLEVNGIPEPTPQATMLQLLAAQRGPDGAPREAGLVFCQVTVERVAEDLFFAGVKVCRQSGFVGASR